jgi:hypothetical protein
MAMTAICFFNFSSSQTSGEHEVREGQQRNSPAPNSRRTVANDDM